MASPDPTVVHEMVPSPVEQRDPGPLESVQPGPLYRAVYAFSYCLSYTVMFPTLVVVRALPLDNAFGHGLRDGARAADDSAARVHVHVAQAANTVVGKANEAYAGTAQFVQERVERIQDALAERRYRRSGAAPEQA